MTDTDYWRVRTLLAKRTSESNRLRELLREARAMIPHADEPSGRRADWCARADAELAFDEKDPRCTCPSIGSEGPDEYCPIHGKEPPEPEPASDEEERRQALSDDRDREALDLEPASDDQEAGS